MKYLNLLLITLLFAFSTNSCIEENVLLDSNEGSPESAACITARATMSEAATLYLNATTLDFLEKCNAYKVSIQTVITVCGDEDGSLQTLYNSLNCDITDPCAIATQSVTVAEVNFNNSDSSNYTTLCNLYKAALQAQIAACGDTNGSIQSTIDGLGDCSSSVSTACQLATDAANAAENNYNTATDATFTTMCNLYKTALQAQIAACGDSNGSIQATIDSLGDCMPNTATGTIEFNVGSTTYSMTNIEVNDVNGNWEIFANDGNGNNVEIYILQNITGTDKVGVFTIFINSESYSKDTTVNTPFYTDNITVNDGSQITGTFSGSFVSGTGTPITTTNGSINVSF